ncbi:MAG: UDP-N-acetyl-D-glucosamine 6-dehydrogenase [Syntrophomonadaceae bacterium]|nr:UDP-N-acetyl-D-glucosamine 6-dehydrogenase [Bacillota bacterium]
MKSHFPSCVAVVGLGYVGLPLAVALGKVLSTIGLDVNKKRILELQKGYDSTGEANREQLRAPHLKFTSNPAILRQVPFIIVTVPTPVDQHKRPDLSYLREASRLVGQNLSPGTIVVYESTVYPGVTENVCLPILEQESNLKAGEGFKVGYSPERINPGDPEHTLEKVVKIVAAQDEETLEAIVNVLGLIVKAGVYRATDIKTAEAAKIIENVQRDLNIALMNELAILFHKIGLDTKAVLRAAQTKWNFLPFEPGLVGGHCIPVDPYYLTHKAEEAGYHPQIILTGRRINDSMGIYVAQETVKLLIQADKAVRGAKILVLGVTFKENVGDIRNSRAIELVQEMESYGIDVRVYDPLASTEQLEQLVLKTVGDPFKAKGKYDAIVLAVAHRVFQKKELKAYLQLLQNNGGSSVIIDVKGILPWKVEENPGILYWSL